jgi:soluble lytic murein transglycosylase
LRPFEKFLEKMDYDRRVLIYAIARQESRFIPSAVSYSYAQGMMQIMPFLSESLSFELKDRYDIWNMFDYKTNIRYANKHLNFLESSLHHPLFIAYAYNGGIGFTKRMLENGYFGVGEYEPFMSIEIVPLKQPREYGKRVLANSVMYRNIYGLPTSTIRVIKTAVSPNH